MVVLISPEADIIVVTPGLPPVLSPDQTMRVQTTVSITNSSCYSDKPIQRSEDQGNIIPLFTPSASLPLTVYTGVICDKHSVTRSSHDH